MWTRMSVSMLESTDHYPRHLRWLRFLSAFLLLLYGSIKVVGTQFHLPPGTALRAVGSLSGYQLAWSYYRYSHAYEVILGLTELAGAALLLFRKSSLLGAALMLPVMANILMINIFYVIGVGALCTSTFIFSSMLAVLWHHRGVLVDAFWTRQNDEPPDARRRSRIMAAAIVLLAATLIGVAFWTGGIPRVSR